MMTPQYQGIISSACPKRTYVMSGATKASDKRKTKSSSAWSIAKRDMFLSFSQDRNNLFRLLMNCNRQDLSIDPQGISMSLQTNPSRDSLWRYIFITFALLINNFAVFIQTMINPAELSHSYDTSKEIAYWNGEAMSNASRVVNLLVRDEDKLPATQEDFFLRDQFFKFKMNREERKKGLLDYAVELVNHHVSLSNSQYLASLQLENQMAQRRFWRKILDQRVLNQVDQARKDLISSAVWKNRLLPFGFLFTVTCCFIVIMKKSRRTFRAQWAILGMAALYAEAYIQYKQSSEIFYQVKQFSDPQLEEQRIDIINKSMLLDGKIELESNPNTFSKQLMSQVGQEQDERTRIELIRAAGYAIIDSPTFLF